MKEVQEIEAIKYALRQSKDGTVVSFVIHPEDLDPELQCLPIGARVKLGWYALGDDEKPLKAPVKPAQARVTEKPERSLAERCAILCRDVRFQEYLAKSWGCTVASPFDAEYKIKLRLGIESKTELNDTAPNFNAEAAANFKLLVMTYESHLLTEKYADVR